MTDWKIVFCDDFYREFEQLSTCIQDELLASLIPLKQLGPSLGRPNVDTLNESRHKNMKDYASMPRTVYGVSPLPLTRHEKPSYW